MLTQFQDFTSNSLKKELIAYNATWGRFPKDCNCNFYICPVVVYNERNSLGASLTPPKKGDAFPTPGRRQCTHKYIMVWDVFGNFPRLGKSLTARGYPSADSRPIRKAD
ncbi:hypothetical protein TNCV_587311 [Trichonephila clavipes]|nr:hypothetical protein TNCV_587311 [Trichonephila clavipes]